MGEPSATERDRIEKLADSFLTSYRAGQRPSVDAYVQQYPELADQLRGLITALIVLEQNAPHRNRFDVLAGNATKAAIAPREIGEFTIVREIGRGGMGVVYEAVQQSLGRHVALKVLSSGGLMNPVHLERFRLEARSAGRLHHSHIVPVFGVGEHQGLHYYAMQFIPGQSLDQVIEALRNLRPGQDGDKTAPLIQDEFTESLTNGLLKGRFRTEEAAEGNGAAGPAEAERKPFVADRIAPPATPQPTNSSFASHSEFTSSSSGRTYYDSVARVGLQVAEALAYAHVEGILHRDIKPSNLLLDAKGNTWVTDFGLAKAEENEALTETGDFVGTLRYMAPERLEGWSDRRSDIYGLGATLYELLTLRPFFESSSRAQLIDNIRHQQPRPPTKIDPAVPRDLETIVLKALAKEPANRYHTAENMADDLRRFLADRPILARRSTALERFVRWCRRNPAVASLTATVALSLVVGTIVSTAQAVRATRAEQLANDARAGETEQRKIAESRQAEAEANFQKAKAAVDKYFTLVSESKLFDVPGLESLRKDLLEASLDFYEGAALERASDPAVLVDVASTHLRMSLIYQSLDRVDDYIAAVRRALDVIERLRRDYPGGGEHERKLAGFWKGRRWTRSGVNPRGLGAIQTALRLEATWKQLAEKYATDAGFQMDLAYVQAMIGSGLWEVGRTKEGTEYFDKARAITEKLISEYPEVPQFRASMAVGNQAEAFYLLMAGRPEEAVPITRRSVELGEGLLAELPNVPAYRAGLAESLWTLGNLIEKTQPQQAEGSYRRAMDLAESLVREFPSHRLYWETLGRTGAKWATFETARGNHSQADDVVRSVLETFEAQLKVGLQDSKVRDANAQTLNQFAWNLMTAPDVEPNLAALAVQVAQQANNAAPNDAIILNTLGVAQCRASQWEDAIQSLTKSDELAPELSLAFNGFFLAMAHWQLDHKDEARAWYDKSVEWMEKNQPKNEELLRFRAEAEQLLGIRESVETR